MAYFGVGQLKGAVPELSLVVRTSVAGILVDFVEY
jgi:hypothetical protein